MELEISKLLDSKYTKTALFWAATSNNRAMVETIFKNGSYGTDVAVMEEFTVYKSRTDGGYPSRLFHPVTKSASKRVIDLVLKGGTELVLRNGAGCDMVLHWAVRENNLVLLGLALEKCRDIEQRDSCGRTALYMAALHSNEAATRVLLEMGADVEKVTTSPGFLGSLKRNMPKTPLDAARLIIDREFLVRKDKDLEGYDFVASYLESNTLGSHPKGYDPVAVVWLLLENHKDRNNKDCNGSPLLHRAVAFRNKMWIRDLLVGAGDYGAVDVNVRDNSGNTALHVAAKARYRDIVDLLMRSGADVKLINHCGMAPSDYPGWGSLIPDKK